MDFTLQTPALIFPAISLLMLAYTNRFVVLAGLIRDLYEKHRETPQKQILDQITNLNRRMDIIKKMQVCGALSFITAALSMLLSMLHLYLGSKVVFTISLVFLVVSLAYLLKELSISIEALQIQLDDLKDKTHE